MSTEQKDDPYASLASELGADITDEAVAKELDKRDKLSKFREKFVIPRRPPHDENAAESIYLCGNSLGCMPKYTVDAVNEELTKWGLAGVEGHFAGKRPWVTIDEKAAALSTHLFGASEDEIVIMNTLSANLHLLLAAFYKPEGKRRKILIEGNAFCSDQHVVRSQIEFHGGSVADDLLTLEPRDSETYLREEDIEQRIKDESESLALILIGGVQFYSGQLFDMKSIVGFRDTNAPHAIVGFDLAHCAGNVPVKLHEWDVDFAAWCSYKYLNSGPGGISGAFVHSKHDNMDRTHFAGWWGQDPSTRFEMKGVHKPYPGVRRFQLSNPPFLSCVMLEASLEIYKEAGVDKLREKSIVLTGYLERLIKERLSDDVNILTPSEPHRRGCQLSLKFNKPVKAVHEKITEKGVICDVREPDVMRIAPVPLYNTFSDVFNFVKILRESIDELGTS